MENASIDSRAISPKLNICRAKTKANKDCKNKCKTNSTYCKQHHLSHKYTKPEDCAICMETLEKEPRPLSCGHWIHRKCILSWKDECPVCRQKIALSENERKIVNKFQEQVEEPDIARLIVASIINNALFEILEYEG